MPSKLLLRNFEAGGYYHLQHNAKLGTELFKTNLDYQNFLLLLSYYLRFPGATPLSWIKRLTPQTVIAKRDASEFGKSPVALVAFLLLPDRFHLVLRENIGAKRVSTSDKLKIPHPASGGAGISNLLRRVSVGYAMYYNKTHAASGTIYKGKYKQKPVEPSELNQLIFDIHHYDLVNDTFLASPLHSSRPDYTNSNPRPWITLIPAIK